VIIQKTGKGDKDFDGIRWAISARSKDDRRENIKCIKADCGVVVATDGHRLHLYTPNREIKDGCYEVVTDTAKTIVLEPSNETYPDYERVFPSDTHNGIEPIDTPDDAQQRNNIILNRVLKHSDLCYNTKYLSEACPCGESLSFQQFGDLDFGGLVVRNSDYSKASIIMGMKIRGEGF